MSDISKRLTKFRKAAKLSQEEVADKLNVSRQTVSKWETGQSTPDFDKIAPLCELYNVSTDELLRGVIPEKKEEKEEEPKNVEEEDDDEDGDDDDDEKYCKHCHKKSPSSIIVHSIFSIFALITLIIYLTVSFTTHAWHVTWIIWLIYAVAITILKLILAIFGIYIDDDDNVETSNKSKHYGLRIFGLGMALFCLLLVLGFVGVFFFSPGGIFFGVNKGTSDTLAYDKSFDVDFKTLSVKAKAGTIDLKETEADELRVAIYSDEKKEYEIKSAGETFIVSVENDGCRGISCFNYKMPKIELYLPKDYADKIEIKNNYGDINVGYFEKAIMNINEDYGRISVKAVKEINSKNNMGETKIGNVLGKINLEASMGAVNIDELNLTENSNIEASMGSINIGKTNEIYIDADADMGSSNVTKNHRESKIELTIRCSMGSINVGE